MTKRKTRIVAINARAGAALLARALFFMAADFEEIIEQSIDTPQSASVDGQSVTNRSIDDVIKAANFVAQKKAKRTNGFGIKAISVQFPGSQR